MIWRVRQRGALAGLRAGRRSRAGLLTVTWMPDDPSVPPRVAYAISRKVGPAVRRNRLRRRLREVVRAEGGRLPPGVYLIGAAPGAAEMSFAQLHSMFSNALDKLGSAKAIGRRGV